MTVTPITADELKQAVKTGILEAVQDLAKNESKNEATEDPAVAENQFARGLALAMDALERGFAEIEKIFPPDTIG